MTKSVELTPEILGLIEQSNLLFEEMQPLLIDGLKHDTKIKKLNNQRLQIDTRLGSLLRQLVS